MPRGHFRRYAKGKTKCSCGRKGCRRARPLCRRRDNPRNKTCTCGNYHFPHRTGSGLCANTERGASRMNALVYGPGPGRSNAQLPF